eukprot:11078251-Alexandrium_andersonii.AAC.1
MAPSGVRRRAVSRRSAMRRPLAERPRGIGAVGGPRRLAAGASGGHARQGRKCTPTPLTD